MLQLCVVLFFIEEGPANEQTSHRMASDQRAAARMASDKQSHINQLLIRVIYSTTIISLAID